MKKCFIFSLCLNLIFLIGVLIGIVLTIISKGNNYSFLVIMGMFYCFSYVILYTFFSKYTNKFPKNKLDKNIVRESDLNNDFDIIVNNNESVFTLEINKRQYNVDLRGYIFKKEYIFSLISRNIRYYCISNKRLLKHLFSRRIKIINKRILNCNILFYEKGKLKKKNKVIKNSVNKVNFLQNQINKAKYYTYFYDNFSQKNLKKICKINEKIYQRGETNYYE